MFCMANFVDFCSWCLDELKAEVFEFGFDLFWGFNTRDDQVGRKEFVSWLVWDDGIMGFVLGMDDALNGFSGDEAFGGFAGIVVGAMNDDELGFDLHGFFLGFW